MINIPVTLFEQRRLSSTPWNQLPLVEGCFVAGGALRNLFLGRPQDTDIDLFVSSKETYEKQRKALEDAGFEFARGNSKFVELKRAGLKVQVIGFEFYPTIEAVLQSFDFTICQFGLSPDKQAIIATEAAVVDAARQRLVMVSAKYPVATMKRFWKYMRVGFQPCNETYKTFLEMSRRADVNLEVMYID